LFEKSERKQVLLLRKGRCYFVERCGFEGREGRTRREVASISRKEENCSQLEHRVLGKGGELLSHIKQNFMRGLFFPCRGRKHYEYNDYSIYGQYQLLW
jgi:hypothetical protein